MEEPHSNICLVARPQYHNSTNVQYSRYQVSDKHRWPLKQGCATRFHGAALLAAIYQLKSQYFGLVLFLPVSTQKHVTGIAALFHQAPHPRDH